MKTTDAAHPRATETDGFKTESALKTRYSRSARQAGSRRANFIGAAIFASITAMRRGYEWDVCSSPGTQLTFTAHLAVRA